MKKDHNNICPLCSKCLVQYWVEMLTVFGIDMVYQLCLQNKGNRKLINQLINHETVKLKFLKSVF